MSESTDNTKKKSKSKMKAEPKSAPKEKMKAEPKSAPKSKSKPREKKIKKFSVSGTFLMGEVLQKFEKEVEARSEGRAREKIFQDLGSRHGVKRSRVLIGTVEESK